MRSQYEYPFTAIVGQELLKLALIINAVIPCGMGVLIRGQKGTAKSTAVRTLANLLPPIKKVVGCQFNCDPDYPDHLLCESCRTKRRQGLPLETEITGVPLVTLPLNATEDNLVGSIDFEQTIKSGLKNFLPGLLAKAHRGILYVDEVNLLDDHLVDLLLSASASGINIVEREGISHLHPSEFILIGTMNPEEGELRPQFLDRFGLCVHIDSLGDTNRRVAIMKRHNEFIDDPVKFCSVWLEAQQEERLHIQRALAQVKNVHFSEENYSRVINICRDAQVAGHRAEIIIERAARAIAAYRGQKEPEMQDVDLAASLALPHRIRRMNSETTQEESCLRTNKDEPADQVQVSVTTVSISESDRKKADGESEQSTKGQRLSKKTKENIGNEKDDSHEAVGAMFRPQMSESDNVAWIDAPVSVDISSIIRGRVKNRFATAGRRYRSESTMKRGRYIRATICRQSDDIAFDATIRAAAPFQKSRPRVATVINIQNDDIRTKVREQKKNTLLVFVVDASGSIGYQLMKETKGAILYFLQDAYIKRDKVSLIAFRNDRAEILLPPTSSIDLAKKKLEGIPTGGKTPLCAGMLEGYNIIRTSLICNKGVMPLLVLVTDGRANVSIDPELSAPGKNTFLVYDEIFAMAETIRSEKRLHSVIIDVEPTVIGGSRITEQLAEKMGAKYVALDKIKSGSIAHAVNSAIKLPQQEWRE